MNQDADSKDSIKTRNNILSRNLVMFDELFRNHIDTSEIDQEYNQLKIAKEIKINGDNCLEQVAILNKLNYTTNKEDLFKLTNEFISNVPKIGNSIDSVEDYKNFINALYKIFYEGSGSLKRIPSNYIFNTCVFMDIKHLRTDLFHDIDHGKTSEIKIKKEIISKIYYKFTGKKVFGSLMLNDLKRIQGKILTNLFSELKKISEEWNSKAIEKSK